MKFLRSEINGYYFKKGKFKGRKLSAFTDIDYLKWVLKNVNDLDEEEKLAIEKRYKELKIKEEKKETEEAIEETKKRIEKLKKELEKLNKTNETLSSRKKELNNLIKEEVKTIKKVKKEKEITEDLIENVYDPVYLFGMLHKMLWLMNLNTKGYLIIANDDINEIKNKIKEINEKLKEKGLKCEAINKYINISVKDENFNTLKNIEYSDLLKIEKIEN